MGIGKIGCDIATYMTNGISKCAKKCTNGFSANPIQLKKPLEADIFIKSQSINKSKETFLDELFPKGINNLSFKQVHGDGDLSNCYFLSSIKALSLNEKGAQKLSECIKKNPDGYSVKFNDEIVDLTLEEVQHGVGGYNVDSDSLGLKILETAYAKLKNPNRKSKDALSGTVSHLQARDVLKDVFGCETFELASNASTKNGIYNEAFQTSAKELLDKIPSRPSDFMIVAGTKKGKGGLTEQLGLIHQHAYCLKGVDSQNGIVKVIDPYNSDEVIDVKIEDFVKCFDNITGIDLTSKYNEIAKTIQDASSKSNITETGKICLTK